jgi:hypothetical protein
VVEKRNACSVSKKINRKAKRPLEKSRGMREDKIKMDLEK